MSLPPVDCFYITEESVKELKNGNSSFKFPNSVPVLRFLYELCWTLVLKDLIELIIELLYLFLRTFWFWEISRFEGSCHFRSVKRRWKRWSSLTVFRRKKWGQISRMLSPNWLKM